MPPRERFLSGEDRLSLGRRRGAAARPDDLSKYETRRREITLAAVEPLNRNGVRGMTLADVGGRLGLAPTAIGYYFRGKEELAASCYLASLERMTQLVSEVERAGSGHRGLIHAFVEFRRRVEIGEEADIAWYEDMRTIHRPEVDEAYVAMFRRVRGLMPLAADGSRAGLNILTHHFLSQLYWAIGWLPRYHPDDFGRCADRLVTILDEGLAASGHAWAPRDLHAGMADIEGVEEPRLVFLRAATQVINELGYLGASVQKISERVNVTKGSFYHHHSAKDDLVVMCFERTWDIIRHTHTVADAATDNRLDSLVSLAAYLVEAHNTGATPMLRSAAMAAAPAEIRPALIAGFARVALQLASDISDGIGEGSLRAVDVPIAAQVINGAIHSGAELHFWAPNLSPQQATELYLKPLFFGISAQPA